MLEAKEQELLFKPESGNVAFASAYDCWAFNLPGLIPKIAEKTGMNGKALLKFMWEQYYYDASNKKVTKKPPSNDSKEMIVQFVFEPLVARYK